MTSQAESTIVGMDIIPPVITALLPETKKNKKTS
jgi:hypothetical protein